LKFSELFKIQRTSSDDWFDPILSLDTRLFIDPFLLYSTEQGHFEGSHKEVIAFFNSVFQLVAKSRGETSSVSWRKAVDLLRFGEVEEICLGYTGAGTGGLGSGTILARVIASALWEAIQAGLEEITHFEEVRILREGIGADRISDITAGLLRGRLTEYTAAVCQTHGVAVETVRYPRGHYDVQEEFWIPLEARLPRNPYNSKPVLLVPRRYLRDLPTISPEDFWEYCYSNENDTIRNDYSFDVTRNVDKKTIVDFARRHPDIRKKYVADVEKRKPEPYDFDRDAKGLVQWYDATARYCGQHPLSFLVTSQAEFLTAVETMVSEFGNYVENNHGWRLLWNDNRTPRREEAAQDLFLGIVKHYCKANDIDISREPNIGRGPVDFKVSSGHQLRALLEVKLTKNGKFWSGLEKQLPKYQDAEGIQVGYFLVVVYSENDLKKIAGIQARVRAASEKTGYTIKSVLIDARANPTSASKL
jgi:hypothetical protein